MKKLSALIAALFATVSIGAFAQAPAKPAEPAKAAAAGAPAKSSETAASAPETASRTLRAPS